MKTISEGRKGFAAQIKTFQVKGRSAEEAPYTTATAAGLWNQEKKEDVSCTVMTHLLFLNHQP